MSKSVIGRCLNIGNCSQANAMATITISEGSEFVCPECGKPLVDAQTKTRTPNSGIPKAVIVASVAAIGLAGYGLTKLLKSPNPSGIDSSQPSALPSEAGLGGNGQMILRLAGSNTIGSELGPALVEGYFKSKGCRDVTLLKVEAELTHVTCKLNGQSYLAKISAHGSGTAFTSLKDGSADVGMASRRIKPKEVALLAGNGDMTSPGNEHVIALDGIAIIVNPSNQIPRLSIQQVRDLFSGTIRTFSTYGGPSRPVTLYRRDDKSGTTDTFKSLVMDGKPVASSAKPFEDSRNLSEAVRSDEDGLGFVGYTLIGSSRAVPIGAPGQMGLLPNRFTISTEDYPLSRRLYLYNLTDNGNIDTNKFISYVMSKEGQAIVAEKQFIPMEIVAERPAIPLGSSSGYRSITAGAERLSVNFRFNSGSDQLDNKAIKDLDRVTEYFIRNSAQPTRLVLIGFADSTGNPTANVALSKQRAQAVSTALRSRGMSAGVVTGFGSENPVASNDTLEGQEKNRRVEVWVAP